MKRLIFAILCVAGIEQAFAGALADQKAWKTVEDYMVKAQDGMATADYCGTKMKYTIDKKTFTGANIEKARWCSQALDGVASYCNSNADSKAEIMKAITTLNCKWDASLKKDKNHAMKIEKKGTTLEVSINDDSSNFDDEIKGFLGKEL